MSKQQPNLSRRLFVGATVNSGEGCIFLDGRLCDVSRTPSSNSVFVNPSAVVNFAAPGTFGKPTVDS
jgi:hypothetical protein